MVSGQGGMDWELNMTILVFFSNLNHSMMWGRADSDMIYCFFFLIYFSLLMVFIRTEYPVNGTSSVNLLPSLRR